MLAYVPGSFQKFKGIYRNSWRQMLLGIIRRRSVFFPLENIGQPVVRQVCGSHPDLCLRLVPGKYGRLEIVKGDHPD